MPRNPTRPIPPLTEKDIERFWSRVDKTPGHGPNGSCWLWAGATHPFGYGHFGLAGSVYLAHRVAWAIAHYPPSVDAVLRHHCDMPGCVRPSHLSPGTTQENVQDMMHRGRHRTPDQDGERGPRAKLTAKQVVAIRRAYAQGGTTFATLGQAYRLTTGGIATIVHGGSWRLVGGPITPAGTHLNGVPLGEAHGQSKLTDENVLQIRERYAAGGVTLVALGAAYGVTNVAVGAVVRGVTWQHVRGPRTPSRGNSVGESHGSAKLTEALVREIRVQHATGEIGYLRLSREYGVSRMAISKIIHRRTWKHVE